MNWHKFNAKRTTIGDQSFPSKLEANVYAHHKMLAMAGEISALERHPTYRLSDAGISYKCDFKAVDKHGQEYAIEAKGAMTDRFRLIKKLWKAYGPYRLEVWKARGKSVYCAEVITP